MIYATQKIKTTDEMVMGSKIRDARGRDDLTTFCTAAAVV
jgi:hypothetical protein